MESLKQLVLLITPEKLCEQSQYTFYISEHKSLTAEYSLESSLVESRS